MKGTMDTQTTLGIFSSVYSVTQQAKGRWIYKNITEQECINTNYSAF